MFKKNKSYVSLEIKFNYNNIGSGKLKLGMHGNY